jgi:tetratricopeptide (TPR) repeat protein
VIEPLLAAENLLAVGLLDQAERSYRQVLAADPRNAIAVVGLSRVALERGDEAGAIALARDALAIDPENASARRMIDRLEEVARFREAAAAVRPDQPAATPAEATPASAPPPAPAAADDGPSAALPDAAATPAATPTPTPAPGRPGLLRRLLRRT